MTENHNTQGSNTGQPTPSQSVPAGDPSNAHPPQRPTPASPAPVPPTPAPPTPASQGAVLSGDTSPSYGKHSAHGQSGPTSGTDSTGDTKDAAKQEGRHLKDEAGQSAESVKETAQQEAGRVADEAKDQASSLWNRIQSDMSDQAGTQQNRAAETVRAVSDDLAGIRRGEAPQGDLTRNALSFADDKLSSIADRLENAEPRDLLEDVRRFAARKPLAFLGIAAGAGLLFGRLTRGLTDSGSSGSGGHSGSGGRTGGGGHPRSVGHVGSAGHAGGQPSAAAPQAAAGQGGRQPTIPPQARTHESDTRTFGGDPTGYAEYGIPEAGRHARPGIGGAAERPRDEGSHR